MKLAEALQIRADLQKRMSQMTERLTANATVQEGSLPAENPTELIREMDGMASQLEDLITRINITNATVKDESGATITALIARRDILKQQAEAMRSFLYAASNIAPRRQSSDIRILSTVDVPSLRRDADRLSKEIRETDIRIQGLNWTTELI